MRMNDKTTYNRMERTIEDDNNSLYEIIELKESEPIIFQRNKNKRQQLRKTEKNNKNLMLVVPTQ